MRTTLIFCAPVLVLAVCMSSQGATKAPKGKPSTQPGPGDVVIEAESLKLTDIEVVEMPDASGGKAIRITKDSSRAEGSVTLSKGSYEVEVFVKADDLDHDTFHLEVASAGKAKVFPSHARLPAKTFLQVHVEAERGQTPRWYTVKVEQDGAVPIVITPKETGMVIDRLWFRRQD